MSRRFNKVRKTVEVILTATLIILSMLVLTRHNEVQAKNRVYRSAIRVASFYNTAYHTNIDAGIVEEVIESAIKYNNIYFPHGPYSYKDIVAVAIIESEFNKFLVGNSGEKGIFQILSPKEEFEEMKMHDANIFDIDVNTHVAYHVLKKKFNKYNDYYMGVIAYNGVRKLDNNTISRKYWDRFESARKNMDILLD